MTSRSNAPSPNWRETWHAYIETPFGKCERCGAAEDRAVHSLGYARTRGYEFIDANGYDIGGKR